MATSSETHPLAPAGSFPSARLKKIPFQSPLKWGPENWGGVANITGTLTFLAGGKLESHFVVATALAGAGIMMVWGGKAKSFAYSSAMTFIAASGYGVAFSPDVVADPFLRATILAGATNILFGAFRYPLEKWNGGRFKEQADRLPAVNGAVALTVRALNVPAAMHAHNPVVCIAYAFYGLSNILKGRLHEKVGPALGKMAKAIHDFPENPFVHSIPLSRTESNGRHWDGLGSVPHSLQVR